MDNQLPSIQEFIDDEITEADFKVALTKLHLYLQEAIGTNGQNMNTIPASVGSGVRPVYTNANKQIVASSSTVGSGTSPVFLSGGTITKSSSSVGSATKPVYLKSGVITECSEVIGGAVKADNGSLAVGSYAFCNVSSGTVNNGATIAGSDLRIQYISGNGDPGWSNNYKPTGTWRNVSGAPLSNNTIGSPRGGLFQRTK